jgi:hypothetical protein
LEDSAAKCSPEASPPPFPAPNMPSWKWSRRPHAPGQQPKRQVQRRHFPRDADDDTKRLSALNKKGVRLEHGLVWIKERQPRVGVLCRSLRRHGENTEGTCSSQLTCYQPGGSAARHLCLVFGPASTLSRPRVEPRGEKNTSEPRRTDGWRALAGDPKAPPATRPRNQRVTA